MYQQVPAMDSIFQCLVVYVVLILTIFSHCNIDLDPRNAALNESLGEDKHVTS